MRDERLQQWEVLCEYIACMRHMNSAWRNFFLSREVDWLSQGQIQEWLERLERTIDVFYGHYLFDNLATLRSSSKETGFPSRRYLDLLAHEKTIAENNSQSVRDAKQVFLENLFLTKHINVPMLEKVSKALTHQALLTGDIIFPFSFEGVIEKISPTENRKAYVCSWERYTNMPIKYVMLFETDHAWSPVGEDLEEFKGLLRNATALASPMEKLARSIDVADARIYPKWIGRITLGPVWMTEMTASSHEFQRAVDDNQEDDNPQIASKVFYEYVISDEEFSLERLRDGKGRLFSRMQKFAVKGDDEHYKHGATHIDTNFFASHDVIQRLDAQYRREIGHQLHSIERREVIK